MKRIIQKYHELIQLIETEIEARKKFYESHGDRWQDSVKGREYTDETERLSEMLNQLNDSICELNETA